MLFVLRRSVRILVPTSLPQLLASLDAFKQSLSSLRHAESIAPQVFLLYYFVLLRGGSLSAPYTRGSLTVTIRSQLPMSAGLGSSAAYTSSLCSGFIWLALQLARRAEPNAAAAGLRAEKDGYLGEQCSCEWAECEYVIPRTAGMAAAAAALGSAAPAAAPTFQPCTHLKSIMNVWAYEGEKIIHGNPSGVDNTCAVYGELETAEPLHVALYCNSPSLFQLSAASRTLWLMNDSFVLFIFECGSTGNCSLRSKNELRDLPDAM